MFCLKYIFFFGHTKCVHNWFSKWIGENSSIYAGNLCQENWSRSKDHTLIEGVQLLVLFVLHYTKQCVLWKICSLAIVILSSNIRKNNLLHRMWHCVKYLFSNCCLLVTLFDDTSLNCFCKDNTQTRILCCRETGLSWPKCCLGMKLFQTKEYGAAKLVLSMLLEKPV